MIKNEPQMLPVASELCREVDSNHRTLRLYQLSYLGIREPSRRGLAPLVNYKNYAELSVLLCRGQGSNPPNVPNFSQHHEGVASYSEPIRLARYLGSSTALDLPAVDC